MFGMYEEFFKIGRDKSKYNKKFVVVICVCGISFFKIRGF